MKTERLALPNRHWRSMRWIVENVLPRGNRDDRLDGLDEKQKRGSLTTSETASTIGWAYWDHAVAAFNRWGVFLQVILVVFCYGRSALPLQLSIPLAATLIALTLRDAWTHRDVRPLDSLTDGVVACVFMMASRALAGTASPSLALPYSDLYRGSLVCLPLMVILRSALRPKPDEPKRTFEGSNLTAEQIYWRTWRLDILWLITFYGLVAQNVSDKPNYPPDMIRGMVIGIFGVWIAVQRHALCGRSKTQTIFADLRKMTLERMYWILPKGLVKGEPMYWSYVILQGAIFLVMGISLAEALWPWLSGDTTHADVFRALGSVVAFATSILSWNYVKESNRAAARVIQSEIIRMS